MYLRWQSMAQRWCCSLLSTTSAHHSLLRYCSFSKEDKSSVRGLRLGFGGSAPLKMPSSEQFVLQLTLYHFTEHYTISAHFLFLGNKSVFKETKKCFFRFWWDSLLYNFVNNFNQFSVYTQVFSAGYAMPLSKEREYNADYFRFEVLPTFLWVVWHSVTNLFIPCQYHPVFYFM